VADDARISTAIRNHPKTRKLQKRLGKEAVLSLIWLFLYAAESRPDGDLKGMTGEDIELAADWDGQESAFVDALSDVGFLDGEVGSYSIHDWAEHNPWAASRPKRQEASRKANRIRWASEPDPTQIKAESPPPLPSIPLQTKTSCAEPIGSPPQVAGTLPLNDNTEYQILKSDEAIWKELYPAVDVRQELRSMKGWLIANPTRRKTKSGIKKFINNWLSKAQNNPKEIGNGQNKQTGIGNSRQAARNESNREKISRVIFGVSPDAVGDVAFGGSTIEVRPDGIGDPVLGSPSSGIPAKPH
jgi:hypothetical protein